LNPLERFENPEIKGRIPPSMLGKIVERMKYVNRGIKRAEVAANLKYPPFYIEPFLPLASTKFELGKYGALYARTIPSLTASGVKILVQISAPLVALGLPGTVNAVIAHEFLHYLDFVRRFSRMDGLAEDVSTSLFESSYADADHIFPSRIVFKDRALVRLLEKKFRTGFVDKRLNKKTEEQWIGKGLPTIRITPETNTTRIPISLLMKSTFDPMVTMKIEDLERITIGRAQKD